MGGLLTGSDFLGTPATRHPDVADGRRRRVKIFKRAPRIRTASTSKGAITPKIGTGIIFVVDQLDDF